MIPELIVPLQRSYRRMTAMLFNPFDIGFWFMLGFSAWLATLGEGAGGSFGSGGDIGNAGNHSGFEGLGQAIREHMLLIVMIAFITILLVTMIGLVVLWVQSRGKFMFLSNVTLGRSEVKRPWGAFRDQGNSLFLWMIVFGLLYFLALMIVAGVGAGIAFPSIQNRVFGPSAVLGIATGSLLLVMLAITGGYVSAFLEDFILPIMLLNGCRTNEAWRTFIPLFKTYPGPLLLYGLFRFALSIAVTIALIALVIATCCCAGILLAIPYLSAVLVLPITVWFRAFSLEYLRQFGPGWDVWTLPPPPPITPELPRVPVTPAPRSQTPEPPADGDFT